jgi:glycosyltransferase involved in cell wall biosynthesis
VISFEPDALTVHRARRGPDEGGHPQVAICMATFEPQLGLLHRQVESIRAQTADDFVCIVSDDASSDATYAEIRRLCEGDPRFSVSRGDQRVGFYRNFERALSLVPRGVRFVALSDQDDVWEPDKLAVLAAAISEPGVLLAYSDMRIVAADGTPVASSYWTDRRNNFTNLGSLLLVNTVTGAASLFRRQLLDDALPFPAVAGEAYHDHWLACVALACGRIAFVERPLHDYVQHGANVVGRHEPMPDELKGGLVRALSRFARNPVLRARNTAVHARRFYVDEVLQRRVFADELERRIGHAAPPSKRRVVRRVARLGSPGSVLWLLARSARDVSGDSETLGLENQLVKGIVWSWLHPAEARRHAA